MHMKFRFVHQDNWVLSCHDACSHIKDCSLAIAHLSQLIRSSFFRGIKALYLREKTTNFKFPFGKKPVP